MRCDEAQELITARVDEELAPEERILLEAHLEICESCRRSLAAESLLKQHTKLAARHIAAPTALRQAIGRRVAGQRRLANSWGERRWLESLGWRPMFAAAILVVAAAGVIYMRWPGPNAAIAALEIHASILNGKMLLAPTENPITLRQDLARAVGGRFRPVELDLSLMKLHPVSGFVQRIGDRDVLVTVYQGEGPAITCFTFLGDEEDAPAESQRFYDADMQLNFYSFTRYGVNGLLHRQGNIICVLTSRIPAADLLALIRGKSAHA